MSTPTMVPARWFFRTRGGPVHGWGNIFRLASFASFCRQHGAEQITFFAEGPDEVHAYLESQGFAVVRLTEDLSVEEERAALREHGRADVVVMEMLEVTWERQEMLQSSAKRVVVFDDLCDHAYNADLVVCGQALPNTSNQSISHPRTRFLVGAEYFLFRPEFLSCAGMDRIHAQTVEHILVTLGGGRYGVGLLKTAQAIRDLKRPVNSTFVLGYAEHGDLQKRIEAVLPGVEVLGGVDDLHHRFLETDLAIVSAGYNKLEAALTSTPAVMVSVQWHQIPLAEQFSLISGMPYLGYMSYLEPAAMTDSLRAYLPRVAREKAALAARAVVDGHGFDRVYAAILEVCRRPSQHHLFAS